MNTGVSEFTCRPSLSASLDQTGILASFPEGQQNITRNLTACSTEGWRVTRGGGGGVTGSGGCLREKGTTNFSSFCQMCPFRCQTVLTSQKFARTLPKNLLGNFRSLLTETRVLRQFAPESSSDSLAKSLSHLFCCDTFFGPNACSMPPHFFSPSNSHGLNLLFHPILTSFALHPIVTLRPINILKTTPLQIRRVHMP